MTPADLTEVAALIAGYWPSWQPTPASMFAAERQLLDLDRGVVIAAIDAISSEGDRFPPPPGLIRKRTIELAARATGRGVPDVDEAWQMVVDLVRTKGYYEGRPEMLPEPVATVARSLGWDRICHDENPAALLAQFRDLYRPAEVRADQQAAMPPAANNALAGLAAALESRRRELD